MPSASPCVYLWRPALRYPRKGCVGALPECFNLFLPLVAWPPVTVVGVFLQCLLHLNVMGDGTIAVNGRVQATPQATGGGQIILLLSWYPVITSVTHDRTEVKGNLAKKGAKNG